jgi:hypothetical protein
MLRAQERGAASQRQIACPSNLRQQPTAANIDLNQEP